jgi:hypothetical protein
MNKNSILFLYEGETEEEFYKAIFEKHIPNRLIRRNFGNLKGVYNLNKKVDSKIESYLYNETFLGCKNIHVFIAYDREGTRDKLSSLNIKLLQEKFITKKSRITAIHEIIATQDLESWFFNDLEGIYSFLEVPKIKRNLKAYPNIEATNNYKLSELFHRHNKHYQKGKRVQGFIRKLNLDMIIEKTDELKEALDKIQSLY